MKRETFLIFVLILFSLISSSALGKDDPPIPQLTAFYGKSYRGVQDPEFASYDQLLRNLLVQRIQRRFGVRLDPKTYSGFDLLEIEGLFRCKKANEPFDLFLRMFPRYQ